MKKAIRKPRAGKLQTRKTVDHTTEERIKEAARKVFTQKGFAAARTRDIAEEAGINLALLNYYFRSKERLFDIIMVENIQYFMIDIKDILEGEETSLVEKTELIASKYIDMLVLHPDLPLFILSELRTDPDKLVERMGIKKFFFTTVYFRQLTGFIRSAKIRINPMHYFINTMALIIFPFISSPILKNLSDLKSEQFSVLMQERKKHIPKWVNAMLKAK